MTKNTMDYSMWGTHELIERIQQLEREADKTYNGWSNYATWLINLEIFDGFNWSEEETAFTSISDLAEYCKDTVETIIDGEDTSTTARGYAHAFISEVNYYEIATAIAEAYPKLITGTNTRDGEPLTDNA